MPNQLKIITGIIVIILISTGIFVYISQRRNKTDENKSQTASQASSDKAENKALNENKKPDKKLTIVTSFYPVEFLVKSIVGDNYNVETIVPKDKTPHTYNLSDQDISKITKSDMYVYMGGSIDEFPQSPITTLADQKTPYYAINYSLDMVIPVDQNPVIEQKVPENKIQNRIQTKKIGDVNWLGKVEGEARSADFGNPHTWLDPKRMMIYTDNVAKKLSETFTIDKDLFQNNANELKSKLQALDQKYTSGISECKLNYVMTDDDSMDQLAVGYGFKTIKIDNSEPNDQISFQKFNQTLATIKADDLKHIFYNSAETPKSIQNLANKSGVKVLNFDTMETIDGDQYYFSIMDKNLKNLELARICG
jgi:zinc transport system substrate-binding protein